ncbi:MAG: Gx transporter family protein [Candidatus Latescibacterota bacterium]|nr:Gx transporter family protein [Candidatus Latescibacterota bacterium]
MSVNVLIRIALLGAVSATLFVFEGLAPRPVPWMKLGLGNVPVVAVLFIYGPLAALIVCWLKLILGGLVGGLFAGPTFVISIGGTCISWCVMSLCHRIRLLGLSPVGVSIWGACSHQVTQLVIAYVFVGQFAIFSLFPIALLTATITGMFIGFLACWVLRLLSLGQTVRGKIDF